jgi:hypothetical protein
VIIITNFIGVTVFLIVLLKLHVVFLRLELHYYSTNFHESGAQITGFLWQSALRWCGFTLKSPIYSFHKGIEEHKWATNTSYLLQHLIRNVLKRRRECGTYLATTRREADEGCSASWKLHYSSLSCIFSLLRCLRAVVR